MVECTIQLKRKRGTTLWQKQDLPKKAILQREKQAERKARTKRLIQIGAEVEAVCGEITDLEAFKDYLSKYSYAIKKTQEPKPDTSADAFVNSYDDFMKNTSV
jgi:hypothetical protein